MSGCEKRSDLVLYGLNENHKVTLPDGKNGMNETKREGFIHTIDRMQSLAFRGFYGCRIDIIFTRSDKEIYNAHNPISKYGRQSITFRSVC